MKMKRYNTTYLISISLVATLGGLLFGYDWVVIGGAKPFYEPYFNISGNAILSGWAVSCALVGCIFGTFLSGSLSRRYGRKCLLSVSAFLFLISALGTGVSENFTIFILYRILGGIGIGIASNLAPIYIAEVSPSSLRGRFVSINQLTIVIGILLAQIVNWLIAEPVTDEITPSELFNSWNGQTGWRYMFWAEAVPASLFFILIWLVPNSPRWLVQVGQESRAKNILQKIGGESYSDNILKEINKSFKNTTVYTSIPQLFSRQYLLVVFIGTALSVLQQWCGINVIFLYAEEVFTTAGYTVSGMLFSVVITGSVNLVFTLFAMSLVDKLGRKKLLLLGLTGLSIIYLILGVCYFQGTTGLVMLLLLVSAIACYAMTLAPVTWVILSEIFPNNIRERAMAMATFALWSANTLLAFFFPIINKEIGPHGSFWLFAFICLIGWLFVQMQIQETKGKSLEEIEKQYVTN